LPLNKGHQTMNPTPKCPVCNDTGIVRNDQSDQGWNDCHHCFINDTIKPQITPGQQLAASLGFGLLALPKERLEAFEKLAKEIADPTPEQKFVNNVMDDLIKSQGVTIAALQSENE